MASTSASPRPAPERRRTAEPPSAAPERRGTTSPPRPASQRPSPRSAAAPARRTVTIRGQVTPPRRPSAGPSGAYGRRPPRRAHERLGSRPDRVAMYAVLLGVLLVLAATLSAHG
jgi:hypothetical protein